MRNHRSRRNYLPFCEKVSPRSSHSSSCHKRLRKRLRKQSNHLPQRILDAGFSSVFGLSTENAPVVRHLYRRYDTCELSRTRGHDDQTNAKLGEILNQSNSTTYAPGRAYIESKGNLEALLYLRLDPTLNLYLLVCWDL